MTSRLAHELTALQRTLIMELNDTGHSSSKRLYENTRYELSGPNSAMAIAIALNPLAVDGPHGAALVNKTEVFDSECRRDDHGKLHVKSSSTVIWSLTQAGARWVKKEMR